MSDDRFTMKPVSSTNVKAVGYDHATRTLRVQFESGTYDYADVGPEKHAGLMGAESKGSFIAAHIKNAKREDQSPAHKHKKIS